MKDGLMTMEYRIDTKNTPHPYTDEIKRSYIRDEYSDNVLESNKIRAMCIRDRNRIEYTNESIRFDSSQTSRTDFELSFLFPNRTDFELSILFPNRTDFELSFLFLNRTDFELSFLFPNRIEPNLF
jgi:hypothetical protein